MVTEAGRGQVATKEYVGSAGFSLPNRLQTKACAIGNGKRWLATILFGLTLLTGCGGGGTPTITPTAGPRPTTTPPPTIDPIHIRTGSAIIPSPTGQTANSASSVPSSALTPPPPGVIPATVPVPTTTTGTVLQPLNGGQTFQTSDKKVSVRYPSDWDAQTAPSAAQFTPKGISPTDPNVPRVTFNGLPVQLDLLKSDNASSYVQTLATQTITRGATNLVVKSVDRVRLGSPTGPEAVRFVVSYTLGVPVVSEQVAVAQPGTDTTFFVSATAPAAEFDTKWRAIIDGIAGSVVFT